MNTTTPPLNEQLDIIKRGVAEIIPEEDLAKKVERSIATNTPLIVKLGCDPSRPDLHIGHSVVLRKLRQFQDLGHQAVLIVGDFTGMIGDPSGKSKTRPPLTLEATRQNGQTYFEQATKILSAHKIQMQYNSEWLGKMTFADVIQLGARYTLARMLERDDFERRYKAGEPISIHELMYPLAQAMDSVAIRSDIELGGTDQKFNLLAGRDIQMQFNQPPQIVMMTPLIEGLDGSKKMSKTEGNYIAVEDSPEDMFGKTMSVRDDLIIKYFVLLTEVEENEVQEFEAALKDIESHKDLADPLHPMQIKKALARSIVTEYHSRSAAKRAEEQFERVVQRKEIPDAIPLRCYQEKSILAYEMIAGLAGISTSEARRLLSQGAVKIDGTKISDPGQQISIGSEEQTIQVGKRKFFRVKVEETGRS